MKNEDEKDLGTSGPNNFKYHWGRTETPNAHCNASVSGQFLAEGLFSLCPAMILEIFNASLA